MPLLPPSITALLQRSPTLRLFASYSAVFLLGLSLTGAFAFFRVVQLVEETIDTYGNTVASQLAHTTLDAVMQRDLISLQAHLSRLLKTPGIASAAIYDVEHKLLAQAGATPAELHDQRYVHNYTAMLSLGDNAAGHAIVTLETAAIEQAVPQIRIALIGGTIAVLFALLAISRHFARDLRDQQAAMAQALLDTVPPAVLDSALPVLPDRLAEDDIRLLLSRLREHVDTVQAPTPAALREAAAELLNSGGGCAYLLLECRNLDLLQRQVSRERLRALLDHLQDKVERTCHLYNGHRMPTTGPCMKVVLPAEHGRVGEALLQAACCADVLTGVLHECRDEQLGIQLQWTLALDWHPPCNNDILRNRQQALDEQRSQWLCRQVGNDQLAVSAEAGALLQQQEKLTLAVEHGENGQPFYRITGFVPSQRTLLDRQITQLLEH